jgi:uridine kinase
MPAYVIGIGGGSASGKSFIAEELSHRLAPLQVQVINQDLYFLRGNKLPIAVSPTGREWRDANHPDSFDADRLQADLLAARQGDSGVVIIEGILVLHYPDLRRFMDLKLFIHAEADERIVRRIRRNVSRGADLDGVCDFYLETVRYRHREFCEPTHAHADIVIPGGDHEAEERDRLLTEVCERVHEALGVKPSSTVADSAQS